MRCITVVKSSRRARDSFRSWHWLRAACLTTSQSVKRTARRARSHESFRRELKSATTCRPRCRARARQTKQVLWSIQLKRSQKKRFGVLNGDPGIVTPVFDIDGTLLDSKDFHARAWGERLGSLAKSKARRRREENFSFLPCADALTFFASFSRAIDDLPKRTHSLPRW